jgi:hypothetical protein
MFFVATIVLCPIAYQAFKPSSQYLKILENQSYVKATGEIEVFGKSHIDISPFYNLTYCLLHNMKVIM